MSDRPNYKRLKTIFGAALALGAAVFLLGMTAFFDFRSASIAEWVIAFALASITFSGVFYFGALLIEGSLQKYIISDETVIKGDNVEMVTHTTKTGDAELDRWIDRYAFTRNLFGMSVIPLLILAGLFFFA